MFCFKLQELTSLIVAITWMKIWQERKGKESVYHLFQLPLLLQIIHLYLFNPQLLVMNEMQHVHIVMAALDPKLLTLRHRRNFIISWESKIFAYIPSISCKE